MVQHSASHGVLAANNLGFGLAVAEICLTFLPAQVHQRHSMPKVSHTQPSQHSNITHWTHMEEMEWPSSGVLVTLGANSLDFGLALAEICQTFWPATVPRGHGMSNISLSELS